MDKAVPLSEQLFCCRKDWNNFQHFLERSDGDPVSEITSSVVLTPDRLRHGDMSSITKKQVLRMSSSISSFFSVSQNASAALTLQPFLYRHACHFKDRDTECFCSPRCDWMFYSKRPQYANRQGNGELGQSQSVIFCPYLQHPG